MFYFAERRNVEEPAMVKEGQPNGQNEQKAAE